MNVKCKGWMEDFALCFKHGRVPKATVVYGGKNKNIAMCPKCMRRVRMKPRSSKYTGERIDV